MNIDKQSDTWLIIDKFASTELESLIKKLINPNQGNDQTMFIRGCISALTSIRELPHKQQAPVIETDTYN